MGSCLIAVDYPYSEVWFWSRINFGYIVCVVTGDKRSTKFLVVRFVFPIAVLVTSIDCSRTLAALTWPILNLYDGD
jgi:hypothetical protein